ncbi:DUF2264 domain-containing protein [Paraliobacillus sediminis]|uniref:DUF2264 domain-containing protein n=1 Tax=Paraliobacillus sediminis TaxID=1885916 RepID=UPI000E3C8EF9|nr:DUF2264 domain-containing protein [Paraliobacillus sediminis]
MKAFNLEIKKNKLSSRADVQQAVKQICNPLKPFYSEGSARLRIGNTSAAYPDAIAEVEGFSRVLWGLAPLIAGGDDYDLWDLQLEGIINGTNPLHPEYWGEISDYDQRIVEMAAFGLALAIIPEKIWEPLNKQEKSNLVSWLDQVNKYKAHDCNWLFFNVLVNIGLKKVGAPYDKEKMKRNLDRIDQFYLADGWYSDGINGHVDYYASFAMHYYGLFYAKLMADDDPERPARFKERAVLFSQNFIYWFAGDGSAIPYGRSMTYRFAQSAFWSALVFAEVEAFPYGVMKGLILRNLRWWFQQPIFNQSDILTIGYRYPNNIMAENYNSPGSPYWALKTFIVLALKEDHPFWQAEELAFPRVNDQSVQQHAHLVVSRQEEKDHLLAFNSGNLTTNQHTHVAAKYEKFVYSNYFGFSVPRAEWGLDQGAFDSMLALSEGDNQYRVKRVAEETRIQDGIVYAKWKPWSDVDIYTWLIPGSPWHIRIHLIDSQRHLNAAEGGFALALEDERYQEERSDTIEREKERLIKFSWGTSGIKNLSESGTLEFVFPNANTNLMHARTVIPTITTKINPGRTWLVSAVFGEPGGDTDDNWNTPPKIEMKNNQLIVYSTSRDEVIFKKILN